MKNNLEHSAVPTSDEIKLYHEGKLGPMRSHEIELLAQENPLIAEALEGYAAKPAYAMLPLIQAGIIEASAAAAAGTLANCRAQVQPFVKAAYTLVAPERLVDRRRGRYCGGSWNGCFHGVKFE
jgi:hypothetical protein